MEKIFWITSSLKTRDSHGDDGLTEVNEYLEKGWEVKIVSAFASRDNFSSMAYIVLEKKDA